jgi:hypothetical protein
MPLSSLPNETLVHIVSYLCVSDLKALAQTYNQTITSICLPALKEWRTLARNERKMITAFGCPNPWDQNRSCYRLMVAYADKLGEYSRPSNKPVQRLQALEFLDLNDDLDWLQPVDEDSAKVMRECLEDIPVVSSDQIDALTDACVKLGLTLPKGFEQLMRNLELRNRILSCGAYVWICDPLVKLKSMHNDALDGYVCAIYRSDQGK